MNVRLNGLFTLRSPLSHIGETISTTTYLVEEPILQPEGDLLNVFCYSGNAWRGQLRDLAAQYMLEQLGAVAVPLDTFHLLFSGGRIGGEMSVDVERARQWRRAIPMLSLFGGGVGNQILAGKLRVSNAYPLCLEALPVLTEQHQARARERSYRGMTFEKSFSRKDDAKDDRLRPHLLMPAPTNLLEMAGDDPAPKKSRGKGVRPIHESEAAPDQMRMTSELLAAGVQLASEIDVLDASQVEIGALVSALHLFARSPFIGGQASRGHGHVRLEYDIQNLDTGETQPFLTVAETALLAPPAAEAKASYDQFLRQQYDAILSAQGADLRAMLGAGATAGAA